MDLDQSIAFIGTKGTSLEKSRLSCILHGVSPQSDVVQSFIELQNEDGGFPFGMRRGNLSTINETTVALWWMEELDLLTSSAARKTYDYLISAQQPDGSWDEDPRVAYYELPPWIRLEDPRTKLYLTAYATYWLAVGDYLHSPTFRKATHYLIRNQDETGKYLGYLHTTWIATGVFLLAGERYSAIADLGLKALSTKPLPEWDDSQVAWALDCLSKGGLPKTHPFVEACLADLLCRQKLDGSWASEDGEASALGATIQVLKVFKRYGMLTGY